MYTGRIRLGGGGSSPSRLPRGAGPGAHGAPALLLVVTSRAWMCRSQRGPTSGNPREGREHRGGARAKWFTDAFCFTKKLWVVEAHLCSCVGLRAFFCRFAPICNSVGLLALCAMEIFKIIVRNVALAIAPRGGAGGTRGPRAFVGGHIAGLDVSVPKRSDKREPARGTRTSRRGAREMVYGRFLFHKKAVGCRSSSLQLRWPSSVFLPFRPHLQQCRTACPVRDGDLQNHRPQRVPSYGGQVSKRGRQIF